MLEFTPEAKLLVHRYSDRLSRIGQVHGFESKQYAKAAGSLAHSLTTLIGLEGRISTEGEMLYGTNEFISYGLLCHPSTEGADPMGTWSVNS